MFMFENDKFELKFYLGAIKGDLTEITQASLQTCCA